MFSIHLRKLALLAAVIIGLPLASIGQSRLRVMADERMELLTIVQYLSGYPILTQAPLQYKRDIDVYFRDFKEHKAVLLNKTIYRRFFAFDAPPTYIYHHSFPDFRQIASFTKEDMEGYQFEANSDTLHMLLQEFRNFYEASHFQVFFTAHQHFYDSLTAPVIRKLEATNVIPVMEKHYGNGKKEYNIVLAPLMNDGGYGLEINTKAGQLLYAIIGPLQDSKDFPVFDIENLLSEYVIHEFSHSFTNPLIVKNMALLEADSCLLRPIRKDMKEQGYGSWAGCLYEHFVRANEIVLTEQLFGRQKADSVYSAMIDEGKWIYLEGLVPIIRQYAADRSQYKTLDAVMPLVVQYFRQQATKCR